MPAAELPARKRWLALAVLCVTVLVANLDSTVEDRQDHALVGVVDVAVPGVVVDEPVAVVDAVARVVGPVLVDEPHRVVQHRGEGEHAAGADVDQVAGRWRGPHPSQVVIVTPERPFPQLQNHGSADVEGGFLWLIELSNGQYCADDTGASLYFPSIGRANWDCPNGLGWGTIHRDGRHWTMAYSSLALAAGHKAPRLTEIPIKTAWF
jgi:hypothetical protein